MCEGVCESIDLVRRASVSQEYICQKTAGIIRKQSGEMFIKIEREINDTYLIL